MTLTLSMQTFWWLFFSNLFLSFFISVFFTLFISVLLFLFHPFSFSSGSQLILNHFFNIGNILLLNVFGSNFFLHARVVGRGIQEWIASFNSFMTEVPIR